MSMCLCMQLLSGCICGQPLPLIFFTRHTYREDCVYRCKCILLIVVNPQLWKIGWQGKKDQRPSSNSVSGPFSPVALSFRAVDLQLSEQVCTSSWTLSDANAFSVFTCSCLILTAVCIVHSFQHQPHSTAPQIYSWPCNCSPPPTQHNMMYSNRAHLLFLKVLVISVLASLSQIVKPSCFKEQCLD